MNESKRQRETTPRFPQSRTSQSIAKFTTHHRARSPPFFLTRIALLLHPAFSASYQHDHIRNSIESSRRASTPESHRTRRQPPRIAPGTKQPSRRANTTIRRHGRRDQRPHGGIPPHRHSSPAEAGGKAGLTKTPQRCAEKCGSRECAAPTVGICAACSRHW